MWQKEASETEGDALQNSDLTSNATRDRNVGYNEPKGKRIEVNRYNEMRMLRWIHGVTRNYKIRNEHVRGTTRVLQASSKISERRLNLWGHVMRGEMNNTYWGKCWGGIYQRKGRGRPKTSWKDASQETESGWWDGQGDMEYMTIASHTDDRREGKRTGKEDRATATQCVLHSFINWLIEFSLFTSMDRG